MSDCILQPFITFCFATECIANKELGPCAWGRKWTDVTDGDTQAFCLYPHQGFGQNTNYASGSIGEMPGMPGNRSCHAAGLSW